MLKTSTCLKVCLPIVSAENWKPATKTDQVLSSYSPRRSREIILEWWSFSPLQVIQALVALVNCPEPEHPLRADLAGQFPLLSAHLMPSGVQLSMKPFIYPWNKPMVLLCPKQNLYSVSLIEEYTKDKKKFFKNAEEFTKKNSEKRPSD